LPGGRIIDISLQLDAKNHHMQVMERNYNAATACSSAPISISAISIWRSASGKVTPRLTPDALQWVVARGVVLVGVDFYHGAKAPGQTRNSLARVFLESGVVTMPYLTNLDQITKDRVTLIAAPLKIMNVEATPVHALVIE